MGVGIEDSKCLPRRFEHFYRRVIGAFRGHFQQQMTGRKLLDARYAATAASPRKPAERKGPEKGLSSAGFEAADGSMVLGWAGGDQGEDLRAGQCHPAQTPGQAEQVVLPAFHRLQIDFLIAAKIIQNDFHNAVHRLSREGTWR